MEEIRFDKEPNPDLNYYGRLYSSLLDRLSSIRERFIKTREHPGDKMEDADASKDAVYKAMQVFESERIKLLLDKIKSSNNFLWQSERAEADNDIFEANGETFIDTNNKTIFHIINANLHEANPEQSQICNFYSLDPSGLIQVSTSSIGEAVDPAGQGLDFDDPDDTQLNLEGARKLTEILKLIIDQIELDYSNNDWYIMPRGLSATGEMGNVKYVIEKVQDHEQT